MSAIQSNHHINTFVCMRWKTGSSS